MTFWPAYKAMRSIAAGQNVAEKNPTKALAPPPERFVIVQKTSTALHASFFASVSTLI
jgi:hypothetical protein